jgi:hypothetical protein
MSTITADGSLIAHDIKTTNGYTQSPIQNGSVCFVIVHNTGKWSDKYSAVELVVDHAYLLPTPLLPAPPLQPSINVTVATASTSSSSTPTTTPVKKPRLTEIILD